MVINQSDLAILEQFLDANKQYLMPRIKELKEILNKISIED